MSSSRHPRKHFDLNQMQPRTIPVDYTTMRLPLSPTTPTSATSAAKAQSSSSSTLAHKRRRMKPYTPFTPYPMEGFTSFADDELEDNDKAPIVLRVRVPPSALATRRNRMSNSHSSTSSPPPSFSALTSSPSSKASSLGSMSELENSIPTLSIGIVTPPTTPPPYYTTLSDDRNHPNSDNKDDMHMMTMDVDEPPNNNEKLYIRIRIPPEMRLKKSRRALDSGTASD